MGYEIKKMSHLFRSILASGILNKRALSIKTTTQINQISKLSFSNHAFLPVLAIKNSNFNSIKKRTIVNHTTPSNFGEPLSEQKLDDDFENDNKHDQFNKSNLRNNFKSNFNNEFNKQPTQFREISEQVGLEDAEPVEYTNEVIDYSNQNDMNGFAKYNLPAELMERMNVLGYDKPFEIQEKTLEETLNGRDLVGKAFTGSGKTLAFAIPIIAKILKNPNKNRNPKCIVLSPTRELCIQLQKCVQELAPSLRCLAVYGGGNYREQLSYFNGRVDIICATPGRLKDFMGKNIFNTDNIETVCLDEADELLTPNFQEQIQDVLELKNRKQVLMFSATINKNVVSLIRQYMENPAFIDLTKGQKYKLPSNIEHCLVRTHSSYDCSPLITHYLQENDTDRCIVFCKTKSQAKQLNHQLRRNRIYTSDLHSDYTQARRSIILNKFRNGQLNVLVATDVAARGLDIPEVNLVMQIGFPANGIEYYIHRSGRCGRAGRVGKCILIDDGSGSIDPELYRLVKFTRLQVPEEIQEKMETNMGDEQKRPSNFTSNHNSRSSYNNNNNSNYRSRSYDSPRSFDSPNYDNNRYKSYESSNYNNKSYDYKRRSYEMPRSYDSSNYNNRSRSYDSYNKKPIYNNKRYSHEEEDF